MAAAQVTEATDTVEIVGYEWTYEYYSDTKDWYMAVIDASQTYVVRLDYLVMACILYGLAIGYTCRQFRFPQ